MRFTGKLYIRNRRNAKERLRDSLLTAFSTISGYPLHEKELLPIPQAGQQFEARRKISGGTVTNQYTKGQHLQIEGTAKRIKGTALACVWPIVWMFIYGLLGFC